MPTHANKISVRQLIILFIISTLSPAIRLFPQICSKYGGIAGWLAPLLSMVAMFVIFAVLDGFFKNKKFVDLNAVFEAVLGKAAGKALAVFFLLYIVILYLLYIRYYAERLLSSMFPNTNIRFFLFAMMLLIFIASKGKIETLARFGEFTLVMFTVVMVVFFVFLAPTVKLGNLLPITYYNLWPAAKATYPILAIWGYFVLLFFMGDSVFDTDQLGKYKKQCIYFLAAMTTVMMITVVGSLGYKTAMRMPLPFFNATKVINVMQSFDRLEPVLLSVWIVSDFIIIMIFASIIMNITKKLLGASEAKYFAAPVALMGYAGGLYIATNRFEMEVFSEYVALPANCIISFVVPILVLCIGKARKRL